MQKQLAIHKLQLSPIWHFLIPTKPQTFVYYNIALFLATPQPSQIGVNMFLLLIRTSQIGDLRHRSITYIFGAIFVFLYPTSGKRKKCLVQVNLFQKHYFLLQLWKLQAQNMYWSGNSMNNLLSYCGLVDARISASDNDLPALSVMVGFGLLVFACFSKAIGSNGLLFFWVIWIYARYLSLPPESFGKTFWYNLWDDVVYGKHNLNASSDIVDNNIWTHLAPQASEMQLHQFGPISLSFPLVRKMIKWLHLRSCNLWIQAFSHLILLITDYECPMKPWSASYFLITNQSFWYWKFLVHSKRIITSCLPSKMASTWI